MITEIKKGDRFRCVDNVYALGSTNSIYTDGKEYESEKDGTITDNNGHELEWGVDDKISEAFQLIQQFADVKQDLTREAIEQNEVEKEVADNQKLIRRFKSGAVRSDNTGRPRPDWISPYAIDEISKVMVNNENDFGACNYMLGIDEEKCLESLCRHVGELQEAFLITKDKIEGKKIARAVGFNIVAMLHTMVLKEKGLYVERFEREELVTVEEAKQGINFTDKD